MKQTVANFLQFNGKNIVFLSKNGVFYVALKPIAEALNIDFNHEKTRISNDPFFGAKVGKYPLMVPGDSQPRKYMCLPERYIYAWIFQLKSPSKELFDFKMECSDVIYDYFKGTITKRSNLLKEKLSVLEEKQSLLDRLSENEDFRQYELIKGHERKINKSLSDLDRETIVNAKNAQGSLFDQK